MKSGLFLSAALITLLAGCETTSGLSSRETPASTFTELVYTLNTTDTTVRQPSNIKLPIRLAVAQIGEVEPPKELMQALQKQQTVISEVLPLPMPGENRYASRVKTDYEGQMRRLLLLARDGKADYLALLGGELQSRSQDTALKVLDLAILPSFIIPSTINYVDIKANAAVIDVTREKLRFVVSDEARDQSWAATEYEENNRWKLAEGQKQKLADRLAEQIRLKFTSLRDAELSGKATAAPE